MWLGITKLGAVEEGGPGNEPWVPSWTPSSASARVTPASAPLVSRLLLAGVGVDVDSKGN